MAPPVNAPVNAPQAITPQVEPLKRAIGTAFNVGKENFNHVAMIAGPLRQAGKWTWDALPDLTSLEGKPYVGHLSGWKGKAQQEWTNPSFPTAYKVAGTVAAAAAAVPTAFAIAGGVGGVGAAGALTWGATKFWDKITPQGAVTAAGIGMGTLAIPAAATFFAGYVGTSTAISAVGIAAGGKVGYDEYNSENGNLGSALGKGATIGAATVQVLTAATDLTTYGIEQLATGATALGAKAIGPELFTQVGVAAAAALGAGYTAGKANYDAEGNTLKSAIKVGAVAAMAAGGAALYLGPEAAIQAVAAPAIAAAGAMALNPDRTIVLQPPGLDPIILRTPGDKPPLTQNPEKTVTDITATIAEFKKAHPKELFWENPEEIEKKRLEDIISSWPKAKRDKIRYDLAKLPEDAVIAAKITRLGESLAELGITNVNQADFEALVPAVEAIISTKSVLAQEKTDKALEVLVQKASMLVTLSIIHPGPKGNKNDPEFIRKLAEIESANKLIIQNALIPGPDGKLPSLWDEYRKTLGKDLTTLQWISAKFWYFLTSSIGIIPNGIKTFTDNVMQVVRGYLEEGKSEKINSGITEALKQLSFFLEISNGAATKYANAEGADGTLLTYQRMEIDRLGSKEIFEEVMAKIKPGEQIGQKMMEALCERFTHKLIDRFLPRVPFFDKLKQASILGIRFPGVIFSGLDYVLGGIINWAGKRFLKGFLPGVAQDFLETGLDQTLPGKYEFKISIAEALDDQLLDLKEEMKKVDLSKPMRKVKDENIDATVKRILKALDIKNLGDIPTQEKVKEYLKKNEEGTGDTAFHKQLEEILGISIQAFTNLYTKQPEKLEELIGTVVELSSDAMKPGAAVRTKEDFDAAFDKLTADTNSLIDLAIDDTVTEKVIGHLKANQFMAGHIDENGVVQKGLYELQKTHAEQTFTKLEGLSAEMRARMDLADPLLAGNPLTQLDNYAEAIKDLALYTSKTLELDVYKKETQKLFYQAFHPMFEKTLSLAQKVKDLQAPEILFTKYAGLASNLSRMAEFHRAGQRDSAEYEVLLSRLREIEKTHLDFPVANLNATLVRLEVDNLRLKTATDAAKEAQAIINQLETLQKPEKFVQNLLGDSIYWNNQARSVIPLEDQAVLFNHIGQLQNMILQNPRPDLTANQALVVEELKNIRLKYRNIMDAKIAEADGVLVEFGAKIADAATLFIAKRNEKKTEIDDQLKALEQETKNALKETLEAPLEQAVFAQEEGFDWLKEIGKNTEGAETKAKLQPYLGTGYQAITSRHIYEGLGRILMGKFIEYKPPQKEDA